MIVLADARALPIADGVVQCVITSPPYWGLRDYGVSGQIGLDATPDAYVSQLVAVFREVRRVLKDDGTVWLNLGDSFVSAGGVHDGRDDNQPNVGASRVWRDGAGRADGIVDARGQRNRNGVSCVGLKPKNLVGIPWRVAFALQADGWYLRSDIIWSKPNPMPESVTDRPTKAHEYLFLLSKSQSYYYDAVAIVEPYAASTLRECEKEYTGEGLKDYEAAGVQNPGEVKRRIVQKMRSRSTRPTVDTNGGNQANGSMPTIGNLAGRNRRSVWHIPTQPYSGAHFATFPEKLVEPCILAGSRPGDVVLDPFCGSGTVGVVALCQQRQFIGCDLNMAYLKLADERICQRAPLFAKGLTA